MKKSIILLTILLLSYGVTFSQERSLPNIEVKTLKGNSFNIQDLDNEGNPMVISFWATWCKPCKKELNAIAEVYDDWQDATGVKLIAISIDDTRSMSKVAPYVNSSDWEYDVYLDSNSDLKRAMGVSSVPHTFLINGDGKIVWNHKGYIDGDEEELYEQIEHLVK